MKRMILLSMALMALYVPIASSEEAASEEDATEEQGPWSGTVGLGYTAVSGNTETRSFSFDTEINYDGLKWEHTFTGRAINQSVDKNATAEAYKAMWESRYKFSKRAYAFGLVDYNKNRFSSFNQQVFEIIGVGRRFVDTEKHAFNGEIGIGAGQAELIDGTSRNEFNGRISGDYTWSFSENGSFVQKLSVTSSSSNTFTQSLTELRAGLIGALNLVLSYAVQHNSDVLPGTEKTDTFTTISLEYAF
jgi:putative salt-induced outer membrane protein